MTVEVAVPDGVDHARTGRFCRLFGRPRPKALIALVSGFSSSVSFSEIWVGEARTVVVAEFVRLDSVEWTSSVGLSLESMGT